MARLTLRADDHLDTPERKRIYNRVNFQEVSKSYDLLTRVLSFGRDQSWKRQLISDLPALDSPHCLDLACGTGDITFALAKKYPNATIRGIDLTPGMIDAANVRNAFKSITFEIGDMNELDVADNSVDLVTGGYALRNSPDLEVTLREIHRVLRPGGTAAFLDFSKSPNPFLQWLALKIVFLLGAFWGIVLHGHTEVYTYISKSLKRFPDRNELHCNLKDAGFQVTKSRQYFIGTLEILIMHKLPSSGA